jgi:hypothetical protein
MSSRIWLLLTAASFLAAGAAPAIASRSRSVHVTLTAPLTVSGKTIPAGDYRFSWAGDANKVDVSIEQHNKVVATAEATVKQLPTASRQEEVIARVSKSGQQVIEQLRLRGETTTLVFPAS